MPEFGGIKITRAQESARHAYRRSLEKAVRTASKGTKWRSAQGCLFQDHAGWFVAVHPLVHIYEPITKARVSVKPMIIDPIFWDLVGLPENNATPLSFRYFGAWTSSPPELVEVEVREEKPVDRVAARLLSVADEQLDVLNNWSLDDFLRLCRVRAADSESYLASIVTTLIAMGREPEALAACEDARTAGVSGGFVAPEGSFVDMASRWLQQSIAGSTRH